MRPDADARLMGRKMTDSPIIFSTPMVQALLAGRKFQTRRLASSPLAKCVPGDRLHVRENWRIGKSWDGTKPADLPPVTGRCMSILYAAGGSRARGADD